MTSAKLTAALLLALIALVYFAAGGLCLSEPWGAPTPLAQYTQPTPRDDPRPFWLRLLLSLRWDFYHKELRGGTTF
jgi:hypothetical protein